jgi:hypothetical protein
MANILKERELATQQWQRYQSALYRGHHNYQTQAKLNENF